MWLVLLVEDNPFDQELITRACKGHNVTAVADKSTLESALREVSYDVALIDYNIPTLPWPEAMRMVRAANDGIPVVVISGALGDGVGRRALLDGANNYVPKEAITEQTVAQIIDREVALARMRTDAQRAAQRFDL